MKIKNSRCPDCNAELMLLNDTYFCSECSWVIPEPCPDRNFYAVIFVLAETQQGHEIKPEIIKEILSHD